MLTQVDQLGSEVLYREAHNMLREMEPLYCLIQACHFCGKGGSDACAQLRAQCTCRQTFVCMRHTLQQGHH